MTTAYSAERHQAHLDIIKRSLEGLIPGAAPADLMVKVTETLHDDPNGVQGCHTWEGQPAAVAERVFTALYGRPRPVQEPASPVEQAWVAKSARDIHGEIAAVMDGAAALEQQPWYPLGPGDLVHLAYDGLVTNAGYPDIAAHGETYAVTRAAAMPEGYLDMTLIHSSYPGSTFTGCYSASATDHPLMEMWMEAGGHRITVMRDGVVVHNGPATVTR